MRMAAWGVAMALSVGPAGAEVLVPTKDVLDVITAEWNEDGAADRAVLVANEDAFDLYIFLSTDAVDERALAVEALGLGWRGAMWGTQPALDLTDRQALKVHSGNEAIGRNRWQETLTILYRQGRFVVGGYTYVARDTLDLDYQYACDVNLFTGKGVFNGQAFTTDAAGAVPVEIWSTDEAPPLSRLCPEQ
jgi:hypothetical protein